MANENYNEVIEGEIHYRTYLKSCKDGGFGFNPGDKAIWKKKGQWGYSLHSHNDLPAIHTVSGVMIWFKDGREVRDAGPQYIHPNGKKIYDNGTKRHFVYSEEYVKNHECHKNNPRKYKYFSYSYLLPCCQEAYTDKPEFTNMSIGNDLPST